MSIFKTLITEAINERLGYAIPSSYGTYVDAADEALTEREYVLAENITDAVVENFNVEAGEVKSRLAALGMALRPEPEPEPEVEQEQEPEDRVGRLEALLERLSTSVERLTQVARSQGLI